MKKLYVLLVIGFAGTLSAFGQEIIPFPDLSQHNSATYKQADMIDSRNYSLYTQDYRDALRKLDKKIDQIEADFQSETDRIQSTSLTEEKNRLLQEKTELLEEAELIEDLNKFY